MTATWRSLLFALALALGASLAPAAAEAASQIEWSDHPSMLGAGVSPSAVSCASESLCVAVDSKGEALSTSDPTAANPSWSPDTIEDHGEALNAVSCAPGGPCVAVDGNGHALVSVGASASTWSSPASIDEGRALTGVSCPTATLCVAVDAEGNVLASTSPGSSPWPKASIDAGHRLTSVSCSSVMLCVAVDNAGDTLASADPTGGSSEWHPRNIDAVELTTVSCSATAVCVAVDDVGDALASAAPTASTPTWSVTPINGGRSLSGVSCASSGLCVAVDGHGDAQASDDATAPIPIWSPSSADVEPLSGISCLPGGFCLAVDTAGESVTARVPPPVATTREPTEKTDATATLAGVVNPNDAVLGVCTFEYGTGLPYTQSIPCSLPLPAATGGAQSVSAQLSGLVANTTYHYRVVASSPAGDGAGADQAFTTAASSLVPIIHPNPSITGTPANGQVLSCHAGTPAGATVTLTYAWLRDLIPIAGATNSTYAVKGQDTGHHLQCQVTASDGGGSATASSAFVTIPVGGVPASAGETAVGKGMFKSAKVIVPVSCSTEASGGCEVALRLTAVETLSGRRVVAIAARAKRSARTSAATLSHRTVTLASVRVHLAQGAHASVTATLSASARRVLAAERHFTANLYVTGTVIGLIEAQLAQQLLTLSNPPRSASTHAARHR